MHMYKICLKYSNLWLCLGQYNSSWQKQVMASDNNLIDFHSGESHNTSQTHSFPTAVAKSTKTQVVPNIPIITTSDVSEPAPTDNTQIPATSKPVGRANKSLFEITRVESHGESVGGDDSELDDTLSETHDSSSTSVLDSIAKHTDTEINKFNTTDVISTNKPLSVSIEATQTVTTSSLSSSSSTPVSSSQSHHSEAPSRFRIVKIAKSKPYDKGKWFINDFSDSQKHSETSDTSTSPMVARTRHVTESGGDRAKTVTSPTEPVKTKSSEFLVNQSLQTQSRGSSYNAIGDKQSSTESTTVSEVSVAPIVTVGTLESALGQIQSITESMVTAVNDEVRKLKENLSVLQTENNDLKDENEKLKKTLAKAEERIISLDKG